MMTDPICGLGLSSPCQQDHSGPKVCNRGAAHTHLRLDPRRVGLAAPLCTASLETQMTPGQQGVS